MWIKEELKPYLHKKLMSECYIITRHLNTSYPDVLNMSPSEREGLLGLFKLENKQLKEKMDKIKAEREVNRQSKNYRY